MAGTNGKGSTIAFMRSSLEHGGYKVHTYTSPHLIRFNERIVLVGAPIEDEALEALIDEALTLNDGHNLTFFEITTAIAFKAFSQNPADILLLEVGMGGRLDCTNVIENPLATIITAIGLDHQEHLGDTYAHIAAEKAGIMRPGVPCIIAPQTQEGIEGGVISTFENTATKIECPLIFCDEKRPLPGPLGLKGPHQKLNALTALTTLQTIERSFPLSPQAIEKGLQNTSWPARLQKLPAEKFDLDENWEIWLDGGHNENAASALVKQAAQWQEQDGRPLYIIAAMLDHKDPANFIRPLEPFVKKLYVTTLESEPHMLKIQILKDKLPDAQSAASYRAALQDLQNDTPPGHTHLWLALFGRSCLERHRIKRLK